MAEPQNEPVTPQSSGSGCLVRASWMIVGNVALLIAAKFISSHQGLTLSPADLAFWIIAAAMAAVRYLDITRFHGLTAAGKPATMGHWRRYLVILGGFAAVVWGAAHALAYWTR